MNIVLLHGWGGTRQSLTPLAEELKSLGHSTLVLEMPGHGSTPEMNSAWDMSTFAKWAKDQIEASASSFSNDSKEFVLLGHSFGGKIIMELLSSDLLNSNTDKDNNKSSSMPKAVVFVNINGIKPKNSVKRFVWRILSIPIALIKPIETLPVVGAIVGRFKFFIYRYVIRETDYYKTESKPNLRESFKLFNNEHYNEKLNKIDSLNIPTLIIWGRFDKATPLWMGELLHKELKNSKLVVMEDTHGLPLKQPEAVAKEVNNFLSRL